MIDDNTARSEMLTPEEIEALPEAEALPPSQQPEAAPNSDRTRHADWAERVGSLVSVEDRGALTELGSRLVGITQAVAPYYGSAITALAYAHEIGRIVAFAPDEERAHLLALAPQLTAIACAVMRGEPLPAAAE